MANKKIEIKQIIIVAFCVVVVFYAVINAKLLIEPIKTYIGGEITFDEMVVQIQDNYKSNNLVWKEKYININGLFSRLTGRQECNNVILARNGMLIETVSRRNLDVMGEKISEFSSYLDDQGIEFTFVLAPKKEDTYDEILPTGVESFANENCDKLVETLEVSNVDVLDLRPYFSDTPEQINKYFFATDHHWTLEGAFLAYQKLTEHILLKCPESNIDMWYADMEQWEAHTVEDCFLGSHGKRVGVYFGGVDDVTWYTPTFETAMSCAVPDKRQYYVGDFSDAVVREWRTEGTNYFYSNPYAVYMAQDLALVQHRNGGAPSDLKVLLIKDSFGLPVEAYMSTMYQELDVIDPRYFDECSVAEYVQRTQPDMVVLLINAGNYQNVNYELGVENVVFEREYTSVIETCDLYIEASEAEYNHRAFDVESGKVYKLDIEDIKVSNLPESTMVALYNSTNGEVICARMIDVEYYRQNGGFEWIFDTPDMESAELKLILYAGINGQTQNIEATYEGFSLSISE